MKDRVHSELVSITAHDALEQQHLRDAIAWVESGAPLFRIEKPAVPPKHLVSYFALVCDEHILLVDHKNAELWLPTGGHVEPDEDPRATVVRELKEELGIDIRLDQIGAPLMVTVTETVGLTSGHTDASLWYAVAANRNEPIEFDPIEFHDARWFPFSEVPFHRSDPHLRRFLAKLRGTEG
ncbi:NUDIX domain-containing protein [Luteimonas sp. BDR2-5]|uniref:NUDIX hydrolase n=1 Tax=Proluteimonas luteida TaxID=2878685 RepID=UPI001E538124|nr:NUDIX domain-containing protein [Luteimonas sp. BDR2-5]MCD9029189.1 NUDIX domain-containing protein [Luteimonas sp. BDR2-5]